MAQHRYLTKSWQGTLLTLISLALTAVLTTSFFPSFGFLSMGLVLFPVLLLLVSATAGILPALLVLLAIALGARHVYGNGGLLILVYLLPMCFTFLYCLERQTPFFRTAALVLAAFVLGTIACFAILQRLAGGNLYAAVTQAALEGLDTMQGRDNFLYALWQNGFLSHGLGPGAQIFEGTASGGWTFIPEVREEFYKQINSRLGLMLASLLPGLLTSFALSTSLLGCGLAIKLGVRHNTAPSLNMPPFSLWFLPKSLGKNAMALALGYVLAMFTSNRVVQTAGQMMYNVFSAVFAIQGLAYLNFLLKKRGTRRGLRSVLLLALFVVIQPVAMFLGIYDQAADPRKLRVSDPVDKLT